MKSEKSVPELEMIKLLKECETIVDDSYLETQDARRIIGAGEKILAQCERLRISRDNNGTKVEELRKQRDDKISDAELKRITLKAFKMGQKKYQANNYSIKLWIAMELEELKKKKSNDEKKKVQM